MASVIAGIFASTAAGVWYDPSDFSSMYQDSVGTTQVTAVEQPVGLMLDKSKGMTRSAELVGNGNFEDGSTGWTPGTGWSITGGRAEVNNAGSASHCVSTTANGTVITVGKFYEVVYTVQVTAGAIQMDVGGGTAPAANSPIGPVTRRAIVRATAGFGFRIYGNATAVGWVDDVSVKEIPGNHILMATTTARPVLSARVNQLVYSEQFDNAAGWSLLQAGTASLPVVTANYAVAPDGTTTADRLQFAINGGTTTSDLSQINPAAGVPTVVGAAYVSSVWMKTNDGTTKTIGCTIVSGGTVLVSVTPTWQRFSFTGNATAATSTAMRIRLRGSESDTADISVWGAQFEPGSSPGNYQRINAATDYNTIFFPLYLRFDGVDDYMSTPTAVPMGAISTFDTSCAFAREQNAAIAALIEYGNGSTAPDGSFAYFAPLSADTATNLFRLRGTVTIQNAVAQATNMPVVMSARAVINSGFVMRYNAGTVATNGTSQAGALTDQILYLGARAGASLPFKGRFYGLMIVGRRLSPDEMFKAERFLGQKSGVFV
ncbi:MULTISPECIES: hypothetical protein [unclassified Variovorax]|uniref:phage head spike fiber domain-containing protein n=1 Tax=unclassified Variovorax TaxID=663243 RepID=UPI0034E89153